MMEIETPHQSPRLGSFQEVPGKYTKYTLTLAPASILCRLFLLFGVIFQCSDLQDLVCNLWRSTQPKLLILINLDF